MQGLRNVGKFRGYRVPGVLRGLGGFAGCWVQKVWGSRGVGSMDTDIHAVFGVW